MKKSVVFHNAVMTAKIALSLAEQGKLSDPRDFLGLVYGAVLEEERQKMAEDWDYKPRIDKSPEEALEILKKVAQAQNIDEIYEILNLEKKEKRTAEVKVRLTEREMEKLKELAKERDIAPSVFAYYLILKGLKEE
uniref:Uncharacterized protein n=1 Tax=uncultured Aquificia bacterium TaxID=453415 RepID=H5SBW0_9BACT|nr:hypothetical protein HGMM_F07F09C21 [uncultured Aquificae bacterium]